MEISLPNFESLEGRIKQLSREVNRIRKNRHGEGDSAPISDDSREKVTEKIENLLHLLEEF